MRRFVLLVLVLSLTGCASAGYLWHVSTGQLSILLARRSLSQSLADSRLSPEERLKLTWFPVVKAFGMTHLGLAGGRSYESFVKLERNYTTIVLSAAPPDSLDAVRWSFPIVGSMAYKGFFDEALAKRERDELAAHGYDVYLRPASAFSTLGWFDDPVLSPMLDMDEAGLANTVLHEMTHATLYFADHTEFNETAATFIGNQAAIIYLAAKYGAGSTQVTQARGEIEDQARFARFIRETLDGLRAIYAQDTTRENKLAAKAAYIDRRKQEFRDFARREFQDPKRYSRFPDAPWNNASLLARDAYFGDLDLFARLFAKRNQSLRDFIAYLRSWTDGDPRARLRREAGALPG